ncbi:MAG TPA: beta-eliminating lyase-related protein, partial [Bacteroidia bacterium]|nr:beta-eliminating lyase-related protein [Bacteroidia bacterium]
MSSLTKTRAPFYNIGQLRLKLWKDIRNNAIDFGKGKQTRDKLNHLSEEAQDILGQLSHVENYFAFPGYKAVSKLISFLENEDYISYAAQALDLTRSLIYNIYRIHPDFADDTEQEELLSHPERNELSKESGKKYFEVLLVEDISAEEEAESKRKFHMLNKNNDEFVFELIVQRSFQDALTAIVVNPNIQSVIVCYAPPYDSTIINDQIAPYIQPVLDIEMSHKPESELGPILAKFIREFRPEIDIYYVTETIISELKDSTMQLFNRIFYRKEDLQELNLSILRGIRDRYDTPFFTALKDYSQKPTGVFHAMPISRGNSVFKSRWIKDFGEFYGRNMFLAETSSTTGGLDSLLQPTGPLKKAQQMAAEAYGSQHTFFVTNGTSTANKIVLQALVEPNDLVLIDRDCHKSHHYGMVLSGSYPVYLDSYPIEEYSMYGAVPLETIKNKLLELKSAGRLEHVKMLLLTNCTFDGVVYNVEKVMEQVLAIKPDMVFLWDEAWFAFAAFTPVYRKRTGMYVANKLYNKYKSEAYRERYEAHIKSLKPNEQAKMPDPDQVRIRVYATQSTHKTLTSFRQGSMIHVWDEDFRKKTESTFHEAYMTHTSTSPNYQILASLDVGRRQIQFEGFEMVEKSIELALLLRAKIQDHPLLSKYFKVLSVQDLIPGNYVKSGLDKYYEPEKGWNRMELAWQADDFVLDPTKITLSIGLSGVDGDTFKNKFLMDQFNIQINKTSRNTVLFMTNVGTTRGSIAYLTNSLMRIAKELDEKYEGMNKREKEIALNRIKSLTIDVPPLPDFSRFHSSFQAVPGVPGGNLREAYFLAYNEDNCEYISLKDCTAVMEKGRELVASSFVIPYPPGFPVLVPGQVLSKDILQFMLE